MKKFSFVVVALFAGLSLNAAVVAVVDGKNITDTEINQLLQAQGVSYNTLTPQQKQGIIRNYIASKLLLAEAKKQNFEKSADYAKALNVAKDNITMQLYEKKFFDSVKVDNNAIKSEYDKNKSQFVEPAAVKAKHILVSAESDAKSIINELKALKGNALSDKFSEIARSKSIDSATAQNGGELGWFGEEQMVKPFADAAFSLKKGEISKTPVKTQFGYHIIYKQDAQAKQQLTYEQVKAGLENEYKMQEMQRQLAQKAQELYNKAKIEIK